MPSDHHVSSVTDALDKALRASESRYRRLFETAQDGILILNADTAQIEDVNPYLINMLGYSHAEFLGKKLWEVEPFSDRAESKEMFAELQTNGYVRYEDLPLKSKAGERIEVEFVSNTYNCEGIKVIQCNIRNIIERKAAEAKTQRHMQLYVALSHCNNAIVHCANDEELFLQICRTAVEYGGMKMAWVGLVDSETLMLRPVASFGDDTGYLKDIDISVNADSPLGRGPIGTAIRGNRVYWCQNFQDDPETIQWHKLTAHAGFAAAASLPLHREGVVIGAFTLYSGEPNSFDEAARDLLIEMARGISFALDNFARESLHNRAEEQIHRLVERLTMTLESITDAFFTVDQEWRFTFLNREAERLLARTRAELTGQEFWKEFPGTIGSTFEREYRRAMADNKDVSFEEFYPPLNTFFGVRAYPSEQGLAVYFRDITEIKSAEEEVKFKNMLLQAQQEISLDAILMVGENGHIMLYNQQFIELWRIPPQFAMEGLYAHIHHSVIGQVENPEVFVARVQYLNDHRDEKSCEEILFKDGRIVDRYSAPITAADGKYYGRVWYFRDITERRQAERVLEESRTQLRGYLARREATTEEERKYIAREVHDELGQVLTGLQLNVSVITHKFAADAPALREYLQKTMMLTNRALDAVRNVTSALRPAALEMGIISALEWLAGRFGANQGIQCVVHVEDTEIQLGENYAIALYRIVQESLTNVARHAAASNVEITLVREGDDYVLKVRDNGAGFDASVKKENSFGLVGIRERALMLAGTVAINTHPGSGTEVVVRIPINNESRKL